MAKYKKRSDGRYATTVTVTINGKKVRKYICGRTIKDVDNKIAEIKAQDITGTLANGGNVTVEEWARIWLTRYKQDVEYNTLHMYSSAIEKHIIPCFAPVPINSITCGEIQDFINLYTSEHHRTAEILKITLSQMFKCAVSEKLITSNPCDGIKLKPQKRKEKRILTDDEIARVLSAELTPREKAYVYTLLLSGIRRGEALALSTDDIDFTNNRIIINKTLIFKENDAEIKESPKSAAGVRTVPVSDTLIEVLKLLPQGILFPMQKDNTRYMSRSSYNKFWKQIKKKCDLPDDVTAHTFRHTYATRLYYSDIDAKAAQYLLGHSNISVTLGIYTHLRESETQKLTEKLNSLY